MFNLTYQLILPLDLADKSVNVKSLIHNIKCNKAFGIAIFYKFCTTNSGKSSQ